MRNALISFVAALACLLLTDTSALALDTTPGGIQWKSYQEGVDLAASSGRKIYVNFHAAWCKYCTLMAETTFQSEKVIAYLNENFVPVQVDADREKELARKYRVRGLPYSLFLDENGAQISFMNGYLDAETFLERLQFMANEGYKR
ncbi:thioredoxin family protein [Desulfoluna butyratoxydans]|uniref:Thioredoxin-like fold n=1 Tax=Desulfoluna butyratoxydans TaxID=231438 RepID=A0A4U8YKB5_9BACT|nr:thioredoxin family protein [Desulfoluna butyratoxydans]VFQ44285.1 thioredoxin-like fold [Desulfoluna butyratoxydans]